jgi:hypothetical protein
VKKLSSESEILQIPLLLAQILKQGKLSLQTNGEEDIQLQIEDNKMDLNFLRKELIKYLLELETEMKGKSVLKKLKILKSLAEKLKKKGSTISISLKGQKIITLGLEAQPKISKIITGTNAIEINNLIELTKLVT